MTQAHMQAGASPAPAQTAAAPAPAPPTNGNGHGLTPEQFNLTPEAFKAIVATARSEFEQILTRQQVERTPVKMQDGALWPEDMNGIWRIAVMAHKSGILPEGVKTVEQAFIMLAAGFEAGLKLGQILKNMMVVNNRPAIWGDAALALCRRSPLCGAVREWIDGLDPQTGGLIESSIAHCEVVRYNRLPDGTIEPEKLLRSFSVRDRSEAGLTGRGVHKTFGKRMLSMRARGFALRDAFPDVLLGLSIVEEFLDLSESPSPSPTNRGKARTTSPAAQAMQERLANLPDAPFGTGGPTESSDSPAPPSPAAAVGQQKLARELKASLEHEYENGEAAPPIGREVDGLAKIVEAQRLKLEPPATIPGPVQPAKGKRGDKSAAGRAAEATLMLGGQS